MTFDGPGNPDGGRIGTSFFLRVFAIYCPGPKDRYDPVDSVVFLTIPYIRVSFFRGEDTVLL